VACVQDKTFLELTKERMNQTSETKGEILGFSKLKKMKQILVKLLPFYFAVFLFSLAI